MKPLVLGLNSMHPDSAAVLANETGIIAAISEERINRKKHSAAYPREAIKEVLRIAGATLKDVTDVAIARDPKANINAKLMFIAKRPMIGLNLAMMRLQAQKQASAGKSHLAEHVDDPAQLAHATQHNVEHHLSHIASSYYTSGYSRATAVSVDGMGDWCCAMIAKCEGNKIEVLRRSHPPHSLGLFYTMLTTFSGFTRFGEEYKVMGLAAYGKPVYLDLMRKMFKYDPERGLVFNMDYFWLRMESPPTPKARFS
jgi:carbamoyltransferase